MEQVQRTLNALLEQTHKNQKDLDRVALYKSLIQEEFNEFMNEPERSANQFKELCDLLWVIIQFANVQKYDLNRGMEELINEYSSKFLTKDGKYEPLFREDGKLLKNTGFKKADFTKFIEDK